MEHSVTLSSLQYKSIAWVSNLFMHHCGLVREPQVQKIH